MVERTERMDHFHWQEREREPNATYIFLIYDEKVSCLWFSQLRQREHIKERNGNTLNQRWMVRNGTESRTWTQKNGTRTYCVHSTITTFFQLQIIVAPSTLRTCYKCTYTKFLFLSMSTSTPFQLFLQNWDSLYISQIDFCLLRISRTILQSASSNLRCLCWYPSNHRQGTGIPSTFRKEIFACQ